MRLPKFITAYRDEIHDRYAQALRSITRELHDDISDLMADILRLRARVNELEQKVFYDERTPPNPTSPQGPLAS